MVGNQLIGRLLLELKMINALAKCIAPSCPRDAAIDSALCFFHKEQLQKAEAEILRTAGNTIKRDLRQFERLIYHRDTVTLEGISEHPRLLSAADIAYRMVWPIKKVHYWLRKFKEDAYRG